MQQNFSDGPLVYLDKFMIAWNSPDASRGVDSVEVGPWPDQTGWARDYRKSAGSCFADWRHLSKQDRLREIVNGFFYLVLGEGLDAAAVHRQFWKIAEYRELEMSFLGMGNHIIFQGHGKCDPYNP